MSTNRSLRIAILAHSANPRGGVVHALALADELVRLGHDAVVHAPGPKGADFFRSTLCRTVLVPTSPVGSSLFEQVETRIADYVRHFENPANRHFDIFHAQDGLSGNALATLKDRGLLPAFARTVHHVDTFSDARVSDLQTRSIVSANRHFVVSRFWRDTLRKDFGINATEVGNGVDRRFFSSAATMRDARLRERLGLHVGPIFLSVGGVEERKNTLNLLAAFAQASSIHPDAQLVIAGGASLLDHSAYQAAFTTALRQTGDIAKRVKVCGPIDQADMPALYRISDALVFPSVKEGFGLAALEAMACGTPVVTSRIKPFTEHFRGGDVVWCDPHHVTTIADAMVMAVRPDVRRRLATQAANALAPHVWDQVAAAHMPVYHQICEVAHA